MERNKPYKAFDANTVEYHDDNFIVPKNKTITLYDGRYCAVAGFIYAMVNGKYSVLANRRGSGTPDFQGYWNCPCGFLERNENSQQGIARETREECVENISPDKFKVVFVQTEPSECNNGNVTIHHTVFLGKKYQYVLGPNLDDWDDGRGGEKNEVQDIKWIPVDQVDEYNWAFGHNKTILKYAAPKWKRIWYKIYYSLFNK